jgi:hypothetical protein
MAESPIPYNLAEAVRAARRKMVDELRLGIAHPQLHTRQYVDDTAAAAAGAPVQSSQPAAPGAATPPMERPLRLDGKHGHQRSTDEPKPWKKPWDK